MRAVLRFSELFPKHSVLGRKASTIDVAVTAHCAVLQVADASHANEVPALGPAAKKRYRHDWLQ